MSFLDAIRGVQPETDGDLDEALYEALVYARKSGETWNKLMFVGNGGSAAIASHMAIDWTKNAGIPAMCFNDPAALTAIGNDLGFEGIFSLPIVMHGSMGDVLFLISSSGQSPDILAAAQAAVNKGIKMVTFSGFKPDNPLRSKGMVNFYVPSEDYGVVECWHLILNHAILNAAIGLRNA